LSGLHLNAGRLFRFVHRVFSRSTEPGESPPSSQSQFLTWPVLQASLAPPPPLVTCLSLEEETSPSAVSRWMSERDNPSSFVFSFPFQNFARSVFLFLFLSLFHHPPWGCLSLLLSARMASANSTVPFVRLPFSDSCDIQLRLRLPPPPFSRTCRSNVVPSPPRDRVSFLDRRGCDRYRRAPAGDFLLSLRSPCSRPRAATFFFFSPPPSHAEIKIE